MEFTPSSNRKARPGTAMATPSKELGMSMAHGFNFEKDSSIIYDDVVDEMDRELEEML